MEKQETLRIIDQLRALQEMDVAAMRLQAEFDSVPVRKQEAEAALAGSRQALEQARDNVKNRQSAMRQSELDIETLRQQIAKLRTQQFQIKTNSEYRALNLEIEHLEEKIRHGEDDELLVMEEIDGLRGRVAEKEAALKKEQERVDAEVQRLEARRGELEKELRTAGETRSRLAGNVPAQWLAVYERVLANKKDSALVGVDDNAICGGCHMKLPPQVLHDVRRAETIQHCVFCGRLLFDNH